MSRTETTVFSVDDSDNTIEYNAPDTIKHTEDITDEEPTIEIDLTKGDSIVLNEEVRLKTPIAKESDKNNEPENLEDKGREAGKKNDSQEPNPQLSRPRDP